MGANDGTVYGLDLESGDERWTFDAGAPVVASPVVSGDLVYIGTDEGALYAVEKAQG